MPDGLVYRHACKDLSWNNPGEVEALIAFQETARDISLDTFRRRTNRESRRRIERSLGYAIGSERGLHLKGDYCVRYISGKYHGKPAVAIVHSAIEYVFA